jgi:hypothetical protein
LCSGWICFIVEIVKVFDWLQEVWSFKIIWNEICNGQNLFEFEKIKETNNSFWLVCKLNFIILELELKSSSQLIKTTIARKNILKKPTSWWRLPIKHVKPLNIFHENPKYPPRELNNIKIYSITIQNARTILIIWYLLL